MIIRRLASLFIDFILSLIPAYGSYIGGIDFALSLFLIYLFSMVFEIIYTNGRTVGMIIMKVTPLNLDGTPPKILKLIFYHLSLVVLVTNVFSPLTSKFLSAFIVLSGNFPFSFQDKYHSGLDLLFKLHWVNYYKDGKNKNH